MNRPSWRLGELGRALGWRRDEDPDVPRSVQLVAQVADLEGLAPPLNSPRGIVGGIQGAGGAAEMSAFRLLCRGPGGARLSGFVTYSVGSPIVVKLLWDAASPFTLNGVSALPVLQTGGPGAGNTLSVCQRGTITGPFAGTGSPSFGRPQICPVDVYVPSGATFEVVLTNANSPAYFDFDLLEYAQGVDAR